MDLSGISAHVQACFATDAKLKLLPVLSQAVESEASDDTRHAIADDYTKHLETALRDPGACAVVMVSQADPVDPRGATPTLDLWVSVVVAIQENAKTNTTGLTAYGHTQRAMRVLHRANTRQMGLRAETKLGAPAFNLGALGKGRTLYFVNLLVRTTESLGAIEPANS